MTNLILFLFKILIIFYFLLNNLICQELGNSEQSNVIVETQDVSSSEKDNRVSLDTSVYQCNNDKTKFNIGDNIFLCVHFDERKYRIAFNVTVDNYEVLTISGAFVFVDKDNSAYQNFVFQAGDIITPYASRYYNKQEKNYVPLFNVVVKMNQGNITGVEWDNSCWSCSFEESCKNFDNLKSLIYENEYYSESNCVEELCDSSNKDTAFSCDPKFYITWFGTDANNNQMQSSNLSMSRFRQYSIGSLFISAKGTFTDALDTIKTTYNDVSNKVNDIVNDVKNTVGL